MEAAEAWLLTCISIVLLGAVAWQVRLKRMNFDVGRFKVLCSFVQIIGGSSFVLDFEWPEPFGAVSRFASISLVSLYDTFPTACWLVGYDTYAAHLYVCTAVPILLCAILLWANPFVTRAAVLRCTLIGSFVILPAASLAIFRALLCTSVGPEDAGLPSYMAMDFEQRCGGAKWKAIVTYAAFMMVICKYSPFQNQLGADVGRCTP